MILTNNEILESYLGLKEFKQKDITLPVKLSYLLVRNQKLLESYVVDIEKIRLELVHKYGEEVENGEYKVKQTHIKTFSKELKELLEVENDLSLTTISEKDFVNMSVNLSTKDVENLLFLVEQENI